MARAAFPPHHIPLDPILTCNRTMTVTTNVSIIDKKKKKEKEM